MFEAVDLFWKGRVPRALSRLIGTHAHGLKGQVIDIFKITQFDWETFIAIFYRMHDMCMSWTKCNTQYKEYKHTCWYLPMLLHMCMSVVTL